MNYESKILSSGITIQNRSNGNYKYCWYIEGTYVIHNEGEPAIETIDGSKSWWQNNECHRLDGPAIEFPDGRKFYYINNVSYEEEDYWNFLYLKEHPELEAFT